MLLCYKYTSTTSAYWIQTDSISVNVTYDMIFFECLVIGTWVIISTANGFYLPGLAPVNYCKEKDVTKSCKVTWSYYLVDFWCTCRTGVICDEWECSCKMTVSIMKKWCWRRHRYVFSISYALFLAIFKIVGFIVQISTNVCYRIVDSP